MTFWIYLILILISVILIRKFLSRFKFPKVSALAVFTGDVKVGKSGVSLACAMSKFRKVHRSWRIRCFFRKMFGKKTFPEEPLFYSNIPLAGVKYHDLTLEHILRKVRFNFGSVVFVDEASLLADCYLSKTDADLSIELLKFFKLFGHETHSGYCIFNSQSVSDLHISLRKCTSQYFYIHHVYSVPLIPISCCRMREERFCEDGGSVNVYDNDVEDSLKTVLFRKKVFKQYDSFAYSSLTDDLPLSNTQHFNKYGDSLKADSITSFRREFVAMFEKLKNKENIKNEKK